MDRSLPPAPSLEYLRKEAKALLAAHRRGDRAVCGTLRLHRRFAGADDAEILAAKVSLQEMQHALAQDYGFRNWSALKAYVSRARALSYSLSEGHGDEAHRRMLQITVTGVQGTGSSAAVGQQYVVQGEYVLAAPGVAYLCLAGLGRSTGKPARLSVGSGRFDLTSEIVEVQSGRERTLDILMGRQNPGDLGVHTRIVLKERPA